MSTDSTRCPAVVVHDPDNGITPTPAPIPQARGQLDVTFLPLVLRPRGPSLGTVNVEQEAGKLRNQNGENLTASGTREHASTTNARSPRRPDGAYMTMERSPSSRWERNDIAPWKDPASAWCSLLSIRVAPVSDSVHWHATRPRSGRTCEY